MKRALINCHREHLEWVDQFFSGSNPYLLPVLNKPLLEYYLDYCSLCGVEELLITDSEYDQSVADFVGDGAAWQMRVTYLGENCSPDCRKVLRKHHVWFDANDDLLVLNGCFFLHYDQRRIAEDVVPEPKADEEENWCGMVLRVHGKACRPGTNWPCTALDSVRAFYELNMRILDRECEQYVIPGYKIENQIYTGMNDVIPPTCQIAPPAMLADNVNLGAESIVLGKTILGENVILDRRSCVGESVIFNGTYIGPDLEFVGAIVYRDQVIDPYSEVIVDLTEAQLAGDLRIGGFGKILRIIIGELAIVLLILTMTPLFLLFWLLGVRAHSKRHFLVMLQRGKNFQRHWYYAYTPQRNSLRYRMFFAFSLDRYVKLFHVLLRNMRLVGDYPYDGDAPGIRQYIARHYVRYQPGVFCLSEVQDAADNDMTRRISDLFLRYNRSVRFELKILIRSFVGRFFKDV